MLNQSLDREASRRHDALEAVVNERGQETVREINELISGQQDDGLELPRSAPGSGQQQIGKVAEGIFERMAAQFRETQRQTVLITELSGVLALKERIPPGGTAGPASASHDSPPH